MFEDYIGHILIQHNHTARFIRDEIDKINKQDRLSPDYSNKILFGIIEMQGLMNRSNTQGMKEF